LVKIKALFDQGDLHLGAVVTMGQLI